LPCPHCKKHYTDYYSLNPITAFNKEFIRRWLYTLHCQVNLRTEKQNTITIEELPVLYSKPFHFSKHMAIVNQEMHKALRVGWAGREDIQRTLRTFEELKRFYDFF
jgi:hypothetical protein